MGTSIESANRRVLYDFTLSRLKSVSIAALVGNDQRIIEAHDEAVQVAMRELQAYAATGFASRISSASGDRQCGGRGVPA